MYTVKQRIELILSENVSVNAGSYRMVDLEPATEYDIRVSISNGVLATRMDFTVTTTMGKSP